MRCHRRCAPGARVTGHSRRNKSITLHVVTVTAELTTGLRDKVITDCWFD